MGPTGVLGHTKERTPLACLFFTFLGQSGSWSLNKKHIVAFHWGWEWRSELGTARLVRRLF